MKRFLPGLLIVIFLLTACAGTPPLSPTAPATVSNTFTSTPSPTQTSLPSATPTASITPLPTIPTFTPTFDVSTIVTVTPAPQAECPKEVTTQTFNPQDIDRSGTNFNQQFIDYTLSYLNSGGSIQSIRINYAYPDEVVRKTDLTGDRVEEIIFASGIWLNIFGCKDNNFHLLDTFTIQGAQDSKIIGVIDINLDEVDEVVAYFDSCLGGRCSSIKTYGWNGSKFIDLIDNHQECGRVSYAPLDVRIEDIDQNGTNEIILNNEGRPWPDGLGFPYRGETHICMWNGNNISLYKSKYSSPYYRFQALQDGDVATARGEFSEALIFYQQTIFDEDLEWFTHERSFYDFLGYQASYFPSFAEPTPTASPSIQPDPSEYPSLAVYAYYRILLLHLVQGQDSEAAATYTTLVQTLGDDPYARPYVEMATAFWEAYQPTQSMYNGCAAAIQYAVEHPEILTPLGSDYHGAQSHVYKPEDVCPFR